LKKQLGFRFSFLKFQILNFQSNWCEAIFDVGSVFESLDTAGHIWNR
jgi:hypothetical protein